MELIFYSIYLCILFIMILLPAWGHIIHAVRDLFAILLFKEIIAKENIKTSEYEIIIRQMAHKEYRFLQHLIVKNNASKILNAIMNFGRFLETVGIPIVINNENELIKEHFVALRTILIKSPAHFKEVETMIIVRGQRNPKVILDFAKSIRDLPFSKKVLFMEISKLDSGLKNSFAKKFRNDPEIGKLTSLA